MLMTTLSPGWGLGAMRYLGEIGHCACDIHRAQGKVIGWLGEDQAPEKACSLEEWVPVGGPGPHSSFILSPDVEQMAIDWLTGNFYFVDDIDDRIFVCNRNGDTCVTLLDLELYNPKGIALDPAMG